jgi:ketosteroid isomerase-like protein
MTGEDVLMDREQVMRWVAGYEKGWRESDPSAVAALFTEDARYLRSPYAEPLVGHPAISDFWVADEGETFTMSASPIAVDGADAVVRVGVTYGPPTSQEYRDLWVLHFAPDGRVDRFEEWAYWPDKPYTASAS